MSEWKEYKLGDFAVINMGQSPKSEFYNTEKIGLPFLQGNRTFGNKYPYFDTYCSEPKKVAKKGDVLFSVRAPVGDINIASEEICIGRGLASLNAKNNNNEYLYFLLHYLKTTIINNESGSVFGAVNKTVLSNIDINLPPLPEQKAIAEVLSSLDDKIDLLHRQNKTLEQMAETLFRQWFMEEAGEDWEEVLLSDLIEIKGGFSYKGKYIGEGSSLLLGMGCVSFNNRFLHTGARLYSGECPISHLVEPGDLVIATRQQSDNMPILGFPAIIPKSYEGKKVIVGTNLYRLINNSEFDNYFFYKLFRSAEYRSHILSCAKGSTVRMITKDAIESYVIRKPPTEIYNNYQSKSVKINNRINNILEQIRTLESLRDTLLPKLMSGEVRIASHG